MNEPRLLAFRAGSRSLAVAVFTGLTLDCTFVRELPFSIPAAGRSTVAFIRWALDTFPSTVAVVEHNESARLTKTGELARLIEDELTTKLAVARIAPEDVLAPPDRPRRRPRKELRQIARELWPELEKRRVSPLILDAAVLGLHHQTTVLLKK